MHNFARSLHKIICNLYIISFNFSQMYKFFTPASGALSASKLFTEKKYCSWISKYEGKRNICLAIQKKETNSKSSVCDTFCMKKRKLNSSKKKCIFLQKKNRIFCFDWKAPRCLGARVASAGSYIQF